MTRGSRRRGTRGRSAGRQGLVLPLLAALIVVAPLGWLWQASRVPDDVLGDGHGLRRLRRRTRNRSPRPRRPSGPRTTARRLARCRSWWPTRDGRPTSESTSSPAQERIRIGDREIDGFTLNGTSPGPGDPGRAGPAGRGAPGQRVGRRRRDPALARGGRAERRGRRRRGHPGRRAGRERARLPVRRRPGRHVLVPLAPGLPRAGAGRPVRRAGGHPAGADPSGRRRARRGAHLRRACATINGGAGDLRGGRRAGRAGPGPGRSTPTTARCAVWARRAVPGARGGRHRRARADPASGTGGQRSPPAAGPTSRSTVPADGSALRGQLARRRRGRRPGGRRGPSRRSRDAELDLLRYGTPAPLGFDPADGRPALRLLDRPPARASSTAGRGCGGRSTATCIPNVPMFVVARGRRGARCGSRTTAARCTRCTCTGTTRSCWPATACRPPAARGGSTRSNVAGRGELRRRVRRRQPRHLDGPLPQPARTPPRAGRAPDVRGRRHAVPGRWTDRQHTGVTQERV